MRGFIVAGVLACLALGSLGLAACGSAPEEAPPPPRTDTATQIIPSATMPTEQAPRPVIVGGYAPADAADAGVKAAEALAVSEIYKRDPQRGLVETVTREQQVVAGMNYRFTIKMTGVNSYRLVVMVKR